MTNHTPVFTSSSATGSFTEFTNTTEFDGAAHAVGYDELQGQQQDRYPHDVGDIAIGRTVQRNDHSGHVAGAFPDRDALADFRDSNGSGQLKWNFSDADEDFDFLSKNQTLTLTYDITVSDNRGGTAIQTVKVTVTGTDDKPVINMTTTATVTEQADQTLSLSPDTVHVALNFTDDDLTNTGHTASVIGVSAWPAAGLLPGSLGGCRTDGVLPRRQRRQKFRLERRHHQHHVLGARSRL